MTAAVPQGAAAGAVGRGWQGRAGMSLPWLLGLRADPGSAAVGLGQAQSVEVSLPCCSGSSWSWAGRARGILGQVPVSFCPEPGTAEPFQHWEILQAC